MKDSRHTHTHTKDRTVLLLQSLHSRDQGLGKVGDRVLVLLSKRGLGFRVLGFGLWA